MARMPPPDNASAMGLWLTSFTYRSLQDLNVILAHDKLECRKAVIMHAQANLCQLDQVITTRFGGIPARVTVPLANIANDSCSPC
jgi:hypothetical protein